MSIFKTLAKPAAVALTVASMACMAATAQAQSGKRIVVAMAPADQAVQEFAPVPAPARVAAPRARHVAAVVAPKTANPDCFWCNRVVYISGLNF
jgi:hypothetical protein